MFLLARYLFWIVYYVWNTNLNLPTKASSLLKKYATLFKNKLTYQRFFHCRKLAFLWLLSTHCTVSLGDLLNWAKQKLFLLKQKNKWSPPLFMLISSFTWISVIIHKITKRRKPTLFFRLSLSILLKPLQTMTCNNIHRGLTSGILKIKTLA